MTDPINKLINEHFDKMKSIQDKYIKKLSAIFVFLVTLIVVLLITLFLAVKCAESAQISTISEDVGVRCIIGESASEGLLGMTAVAEALRNRGHTGGVYGCSAKFVDNEPKWVWDLAAKAWAASATSNMVYGADMWENIVAFGKPSWYNCVVKTTTIGNHTFFKEKRPCTN